jgi:hypothetical protein
MSSEKTNTVNFDPDRVWRVQMAFSHHDAFRLNFIDLFDKNSKSLGSVGKLD